MKELNQSFKRVLVGSGAAKHWLPNFRSPGDRDFFQNYPSDGRDDVTVLSDEIIDLIPHENGVATLDALYTIKCSHLGWDILWNKHRRDATLFKDKGAVFIDTLYEALKAHWEEEHGKKDYLSLYKTKDAFFNDYVTYTYDHDYLHKLVAHPNPPMYESCLKEGEEVAICRGKFQKLPLDDKLKMFQEEITVIACERWLLNPSCKGQVSTHQAYSYALRKTTTSLTKGWATDFIIINMNYYMKPNFKMFEHILKTLREE